ncbi:MAG: hypothetical protein D6790_05315, partial [Caldilineae bacterium]
MPVLGRIVETCEQRNILWVLTGSLAFALQGVACPVHDIDVQTDAAGAYALADAFPGDVVEPVVYRISERIRSHFGVLTLQGVRVEVMGALEKRLPGGSWQPAPDLAGLRRWIEVDALRIPMLPLHYEAAAYRQLGRLDKARLLEAAARK